MRLVRHLHLRVVGVGRPSASRRSAAVTTVAAASPPRSHAAPGWSASLHALGRRRPRPRQLVRRRSPVPPRPPLAATSRLTVDGARPAAPRSPASTDPRPGRGRSPPARPSSTGPRPSPRIGPDPTTPHQIGPHPAGREPQRPSRRLGRMTSLQPHPDLILSAGDNLR